MGKVKVIRETDDLKSIFVSIIGSQLSGVKLTVVRHNRIKTNEIYVYDGNEKYFFRYDGPNDWELKHTRKEPRVA